MINLDQTHIPILEILPTKKSAPINLLEKVEPSPKLKLTNPQTQVETLPMEMDIQSKNSDAIDMFQNIKMDKVITSLSK